MSPEKWVKSIVASLFRHAGYELVHTSDKARSPARLAQRPFNVLTFILPSLIARPKPFFFVQVGANDGIRWDPLHELVIRHRLRGLLVEPIPDLFSDLKSNYADQPQLRFECAALSREAGQRPLYRVRKDAPFGDWAQGIASFNREHLMEHLKAESDDFENYIETLDVSCVSADSLLKKHQISEVSLLQIDTEGHDFEILKMFFEAGILPEVINFERVHLSLHDQNSSRELLISQGYRFIDVGADTLAVEDSLAPPSGKTD